MRFKLKYKKYPKYGDIKEKVKFLFFPLELNNERRWLEFAKIEYKYSEPDYDYEGGWSPIRWLFYDPIKDCELSKKDGCSHVDGPLCNGDCEMMKNFNKEQK